MRSTRRALLLLVLLSLTAQLLGCGKSDTNSGATSINREQFKELQVARKNLTALIDDLRGAVQAQEPVNERNARVHSVFKQSRDFPLIQNLTEPGALAEKEKKALQGTTSGELLALYRQKRNNKKGGGTSASSVALQYLGAVHALYGLQDFESYMAQHTVGDGTKPNPKDPPVSMGGGWAVAWSGIGLNPMVENYVRVTVGYDPGPGVVRYFLGTGSTDPDLPDPQVTPMTVERAIIQYGESLAREGDSLLVEQAGL